MKTITTMLTIIGLAVFSGCTTYVDDDFGDESTTVTRTQHERVPGGTLQRTTRTTRYHD